MNVRLQQRLSRAQKLLLRPRVFARPITIFENLNKQPTSQSPSLEGNWEVWEDGKRRPQSLNQPVTERSRTVSNVHPALAKGYTVGGHLKRKPLISPELDENGVPMWTASGIPIRTHGMKMEVIKMPHFWLRDNCRCSKCVNQDTMQRAFDTFSIPRDIVPSEATTEKEGLRVKWANDGHLSIYPWNWLHKSWIEASRADQEGSERKRPHVFWGAEIAADPPSVHYDEIMADDKGVGKWTETIRKFGFSYVDGSPVSPEKTQELLERIAFIRVTHYGGFYDFTSDLTMKDTAYTSLALPAHTDTAYFTDPAGLQMFHLLSHEGGEGGASLLVDGFQASNTLRRENPRAWNALARIPITWHASGNDGITITPAKKFPVLNQAPRYEVDALWGLYQIRWNNDDRGAVDLSQGKDRVAQIWYNAAAKFNEILRRKENEYWAQLKPGKPLIFDNWRVLHGRSAFTGKRRMCGGYINHDDYVSRWRNTNFMREEALSQII